jgi:hypothetical protein
MAIRDWARSSGWAVSDRDRLPSNVVEAYDAAHKLTNSTTPVAVAAPPAGAATR